MKTIRYYSFKVADDLDLNLIADYFKINRPIKWSDNLMIDNTLVESVVKRPVSGHQVYFYKYGVISFIGFFEDEMREMVSLLNTIIPINYTYFASYYEHYQAKTGDHGEFFLSSDSTLSYKKMAPIIAETIAKSVGLNHMEIELSSLMNKVEPLLDQMDRGKVKIDKRTKKILGETLAFKYNLTTTLDIFDRPRSTQSNSEIKEGYDYLSELFELNDRYAIVENKIDDLKKIIYKYYNFNHHKKERDLYIFEVALLVCFPLSSFLTTGHLKMLIKWIISIFN